MSVQSVSIASMFGWVAGAFGQLKRNPRGMMAASGLMLLFGILICVPMLLIMSAIMFANMKSGGIPSGVPMGGYLTLFWATYGVTILLFLLLFPPMVVGWFRLCRDIDQGNAASGTDIVRPYQDRQLWLRSIGFALLVFLVYVLVFGLLGFAFSGIFSDFLSEMAAQQAAALAGAPPAPPHFTAGFVLAYFLFIGVSILLQMSYMIGFAELALRPTSAPGALKLAIIAVSRNLLKLIVFLVGLCFLSFIAIILVAIVLGAIIGLLSLVHWSLALLAALLLYIPFLLCIYPLLFAGQYLAWKGMLGGDETTLTDTAGSSFAA